MRKADREKFKRLAEQRVNRAIKTVRLIGNLSNKSNYDYTDEDVERIFSALNAEIRACRARFNDKVRKDENEFKLD